MRNILRIMLEYKKEKLLKMWKEWGLKYLKKGFFLTKKITDSFKSVSHFWELSLKLN